MDHPTLFLVGTTEVPNELNQLLFHGSHRQAPELRVFGCFVQADFKRRYCKAAGSSNWKPETGRNYWKD
jgi:hypothetical protein